jgi:hypothetical protein
MNVQQIACDRPALERLLADRLNDSELAALEAHLDGCPACRQCLDDLAADGTLWQEARGYLTSGDASSDSGPASPTALAGLRAYLTPTDDPRLLGRLGAYGVVGLIGCGGFGVVLKAFDAALNRYVAIKALSPHLAAAGAARQRFAREARAAAAVVHDNVVAIHAVAEADGLPYFVMPYVSGPSLEKRLRQTGSCSVVEVLRVGRQIAAGLAAAHAQGLVHRDIKPANILLENGAERVTITDFGLARAVDDASLTRSGVIAGTPPYMSPEQAAGLAVDHRSDLFSLGSVLYAMCTGRPPFRAETTLAVLRRVEECRPRPIREINPEIPVWLAGIVGKLHAANPAERFQTAAEVADLLEQCLAHVQQPAAHPLPAAAAALGRPARRHWWWLPAAAAVAACVLVLTYWPVEKQPKRVKADLRSPDSEPTGRIDDDILDRSQRVRGDLGQLQMSLADDSPAVDPIGPAVQAVRSRVEALWQTVDDKSGGVGNPFAADANSVRQRLSALDWQINRKSE